MNKEEKEKNLLEIERIEKSRDIDKFDLSQNNSIYIGGLAILFSLALVSCEAFNLEKYVWIILFLTLIGWSINIYIKNIKIKLYFDRKTFMIDKRYKKLKLDINKLNDEMKSITKENTKNFYK